jgi:hypothetical protein
MRNICIQKDGETKGFFSLEEIKDRIKIGIFSISDLCWMDSWGEWKPLSYIIRETELKPKLIPISEYIKESSISSIQSKEITYEHEFIDPFVEKLRVSSGRIVDQEIIIGRFGNAGVIEKWYILNDPVALGIALLSYFALFLHAGKQSAVTDTLLAIVDYQENLEQLEDGNLIRFIYEKIRESLNTSEANAMDGLFEYGRPFSLNTADSFKDKATVLKRFSTKCVYTERGFQSSISLIWGMNIVALPLGLGILYENTMRQMPLKVSTRTNLGIALLSKAFLEKRIASNKEATGQLNIAIYNSLLKK